MQTKFTPLLYISDMEHMEPLARALLKHGADLEMATGKVSILYWMHLEIVLVDKNNGGGLVDIYSYILIRHSCVVCSNTE